MHGPLGFRRLLLEIQRRLGMPVWVISIWIRKLIELTGIARIEGIGIYTHSSKKEARPESCLERE